MKHVRRRRTLVRRTALTAAAVAAVSAALLSTGAASTQAASASASGSVNRYVALGDSYAAGTGLTPVKNTACKRSSNSYPSWIAKNYKPTIFKDVTCSGATTKSLWNTQGSAAPQLSALTKDTDLVTVTLGGNDLGFADVLVQCVLVASKPSATNSPCKDRYAGSVESKLGWVATRTRAMITDIERRSPNARIFVVGYPQIFPTNGAACGASVPLAKGDVSYLDRMTRELNIVQALQVQLARNAGKHVKFVNTYPAFQGKDMCQTGANQWVNPLLPLGAGSAHPNLAGHLTMANRVYTAIEG